MMTATISNVIEIDDPSPELKQYVKDELELPNPDYEKKLRMGFWTGRTPKKIRLYEWHGNRLILPFGLCRDILPMLRAGEVKTAFKEPEKVDYGKPIPLYDYQQEAVDKMVGLKYGILKAPAGSGKGLPLNAKIYTPDGFTRNGDLQIGDEVLTSYGEVCKVTGIYDRGKQYCYKITFTDDTEIICDKDHLWNIRNARKSTKEWETLRTEDIYLKGITDEHGNRMWEIPIAEPVYFKSRKVTIDPWLLGVLLGDGTFVNHEVSVSNSEQDILDRVQQLANCNVYHRKDRVSMILNDNGSLHYRLKDYDLQGLHSWEKHIPKDYKYNSIDVRLKILQGIIDTDGSVIGNNITVTSASRRLMEDCLEIVQSLGGTGKISVRHTKYTYAGEKKDGRESYRLSLKLYLFHPFTSKKHCIHYQERTRYGNAYRRIKSIVPTAPRLTRCIEVDSKDSLYLTNGFVVTHNTQCGIAMISQIGTKALWLCAKHDLLKQSYDRAKQYMDEDLFGTITEGKVSIGKGITFSTVQTLAGTDLNRYRDEWDVVIVDECHGIGVSATTVTRYQKVLNNLAAKHKYGLSATPDRSDGLIKATFSLIGNVVCEIPESAVADRIMRVKVKAVETEAEVTEECQNVDGTLNYTRLIEHLTTDTDRNRLIARMIMEEKDHSCLVLSDRIAHLEALRNLLPYELQEKSALITGKMTSKKDKALREEILEQMRTGELKYLFASYSLAKEGLDVPRLDRLFLATPVKFSSVVIQSIGRIARTFPGKGEPVVYDFVDTGIGFCKRAYRERRKHYKTVDAKIVQWFD